ncbi:MAG: hypothetical protein D6815_00780 [Candidatus Dadabacteria bacterium]|nr:MAG: hypothetical protein D6815_00780 [Candidatus Dadabacteria bacterium]
MRARRVSPGRITRTALGMTAVAAVLSAATGCGSPASLAAGGLFMAVDFHLIRLLVSTVMTPGRSRTAAFLLVAAKGGLLLGLLGFLFYRFPLEPLSFAAGTSLLLAAAVADAVWLGEPVGAEASPES